MTVPSEAELRLDGSGGGSDRVDGSVAHHGNGSGGVAYARGGQVVSERDVERVMQTVLHRPMATHALGSAPRLGRHRRHGRA